MNDFYARTMLNTQRLEEETGLTPAQILALPMDEYARLTGRPTGSQLAGQAADFEPPGTPRQDPAPAQTAPLAPAPQAGIDVARMDMQTYAATREQLGMGRNRQEGVGIFDSVGSGSEAYTAAVRAQAGRTGWATGNVVESPRMDRAYVQPDPVDSRPAVQRFAAPGGVFGS